MLHVPMVSGQAISLQWPIVEPWPTPTGSVCIESAPWLPAEDRVLGNRPEHQNVLIALEEVCQAAAISEVDKKAHILAL